GCWNQESDGHVERVGRGLQGFGMRERIEYGTLYGAWDSTQPTERQCYRNFASCSVQASIGGCNHRRTNRGLRVAVDGKREHRGKAAISGYGDREQQSQRNLECVWAGVQWVGLWDDR